LFMATALIEVGAGLALGIALGARRRKRQRR